MAGLGFKDFQVAEVLTAADVDGYLMQQSVMRFASSAARGSALGTAVGTAVPLAEGMVSYLDDSDRLQIFDGSVWRTAGSILQVLQTTKTDTFSTTSSTFVDVTGVSVSITPESNTNKVLIQVSGLLGHSATDATNIELRRGSTSIGVAVGGTSQNSTTSYTASSGFGVPFSITFLDSPATTSATTYSIRARTNSAGTAYVGRPGVQDIRCITTITAIEVAA